MTSRREKAKEANKRKIIEAARELVLESGSTDFTMKELAARASVSTFTTHNLVGTKARVLFQVLVEHIDEIRVRPVPKDPTIDEIVDYCLSFAEIPVVLYEKDEPFYRAIIRYYMASNDTSLRRIYLAKACRYWTEAVNCMARLDLLSRQSDRSDLARAMHVGYTGTMEFWVHGELSTSGLRAQSKGVLALILLGTAQSKFRVRLWSALEQCRVNFDAE